MLAFHMQVIRAIFQRRVLQLSVVNEAYYEIIATIITKLTSSNSRRCQQRNGNVSCMRTSKICLFKFVNNVDIYLGVNCRGLTKCKITDIQNLR